MHRGHDILKIYDKDYNWIGTATREEVHAKGLLHQVAHIWIVQWSGREAYIMIQKRSMKRDLYPGKYDLIQTTHFDPEESYEDGIHHSLDYYLGARLSKENIAHLGTFRQHMDQDGYHDNAMIQCFAITVQKALFIMPDTEEIVKVKFSDFCRFVHGLTDTIDIYSLDDEPIGSTGRDEWWIRSEEFVEAVEPYIYSKEIAY